MRVLGRRSSANVQKVLWCLVELGEPYRQEDYGGEFGGNRDPSFLRLNPNGTVPVLIDGDVAIWESNTILRYLANRFAPTALYPAEPVARADCERWIDWQLSALNPVMAPLFVAMVRTPPDKRDPAVVEGLRVRADALFGILDEALSRTRWLSGDAMTLADLAVGMFAYRWLTLDLERDRSADHLARWYRALSDRPGFREHVMVPLS